MSVDYNQYLAKPDQSIKEHADALLRVLKQLIELGYIKDEHVIELTKMACIHHDDGKANPMFQKRIRSNAKFNEENEVAHNVLSACMLDEKEFTNEEDYCRVLFVIMYHHDYGNPYEIYIARKQLIKELLQDLEYHTIKRNFLNKQAQYVNDPITITVKGFLHKCDYSASGKYIAEYPNDFLVDSLENVRSKWRKFNPNSDWNALQCFAMQHTNENIIMVAQTGMGKTEAGLHWIGNHKGFFVLPLRTAINAMYERIANDVLLGNDCETKVAILHSDSLEYYMNHTTSEEMNLLEYEKRGKRFSMPLSISTMDQMFDFVFQYPGYELNLVTYSYSKIVIDEIQMYDPKLLAYLIFGLKKIVEFGGKVAIMTATLSPFIRDLLKENIPFHDDCISTFTNDLIRHNIKTMDYDINVEDVIKLYNKNIVEDKSNKILIVCNTIKKAQELYRILSEELPGSVSMLHSRYIRLDRLTKEKEILKFGRTFNEQGHIDNQSGIWISTSLVEASLDIDFDYLFTELQDLNSLFQRMGRCNRKGVKSTKDYNCYVYLTSSNNHIDQTMLNLSRVALQNTGGLLSEQKKIELIETYFTMDNIKESDYYKGHNGYRVTMDWLKNISPYENKKEENVLRDIYTKEVVPNMIYIQHQDEIETASKMLHDSNLSYLERCKYKECIMQYTVSIPYCNWVKYQKNIRDNLAEKYVDINMGGNHIVSVMECIYDDTGFNSLNYEKVIREPNIL